MARLGVRRHRSLILQYPGWSLAVGLALCVPIGAQPAPSQDYPKRSVRMLVGSPPGAATDVVARLIAPKYAEALKQQFIVDNRPGANGTVATGLTAKAKPDGHTVHLATIGSLVIAPALTKVPYDPMRDLAPVSQVVSLQNVFIVDPGLPAATLNELIALAKKQPGALHYATSGNGSPGHLAGELFKSMARVDILHVPYTGGGPLPADLAADQPKLFVVLTATAVPPVKAGKARALAVTGSKRVAALPEVPTVAETGLGGYEASTWYGMVVPAGTPQRIIDRLHKETATILSLPDIQKALQERGIEVAPSLPEQFFAYIKGETAKWAKVIEVTKLEAKSP